MPDLPQLVQEHGSEFSRAFTKIVRTVQIMREFVDDRDFEVVLNTLEPLRGTGYEEVVRDPGHTRRLKVTPLVTQKTTQAIRSFYYACLEDREREAHLRDMWEARGKEGDVGATDDPQA